MNFYGKDLPVFKSALHTHTTTSDGKKSPQETIALYADAGYDVIVLSDHMKTNHIAKLDHRGMNVISGIELFANGPREITWHVLAIGVPEDFPGEKYDVQTAIDKINACGGLAYCAHPFWSGLTSVAYTLCSNQPTYLPKFANLNFLEDTTPSATLKNVILRF